MQTNSEFKAIAKAVNAWRKNKACRNSKVPNELVTAIRKLGKHHKPGKIATALKMSHSTISKLMGTEFKKPNFIEVLAPTTLSLFSCTLQRPDGAKLAIELQKEHMSILMEAFLCSK